MEAHRILSEARTISAEVKKVKNENKKTTTTTTTNYYHYHYTSATDDDDDSDYFCISEEHTEWNFSSL